MNKLLNEKEINFIRKYNYICCSVYSKKEYPKLQSEFDACNANGNFIRYSNGVYTYGEYERGIRGELYSSDNERDVLYYPVELAIEQLAMDYESKNRVKGQDYRILYFRKAVEYMMEIDLEWAEKLRGKLSKYIEF